MGYKVVERFREKMHDNRIYEVNKEYPAKGYKSSKARIEELSSEKNKYKTAFIEEVQAPKKEKE